MRIKSKGWVALPRAYVNHPFLRGKPEMLGAFSFLYSHTESQHTVEEFEGISVSINRGQIAITNRLLQIHFGWSQSKVNRFLSGLTKHGIITKKAVDKACTVITFPHYGKDAVKLSTDGQWDLFTGGQQTDTASGQINGQANTAQNKTNITKAEQVNEHQSGHQTDTYKEEYKGESENISPQAPLGKEGSVDTRNSSREMFEKFIACFEESRKPPKAEDIEKCRVWWNKNVHSHEGMRERVVCAQGWSQSTTWLAGKVHAPLTLARKLTPPPTYNPVSKRMDDTFKENEATLRSLGITDAWMLTDDELCEDAIHRTLVNENPEHFTHVPSFDECLAKYKAELELQNSAA